ncbi:MAG: ATP-dependent Clp protease adaptor ClpS [Armatimonadetes bacterium]|nr:ATP-dependent Clp protease adaptor ClpS [Armatimonadota bacterium]
MSGQRVSEPLVAPGIIRDIEESGEYVVVIFNNDDNTYDEVIAVLIHATECDMHEATLETWEADTFGSAKVHFGTSVECRHVARVISTIGVRTAVRKEFESEPV